MEAMDLVLLALQDKYQGNWMQIYNSLQVREQPGNISEICEIENIYKDRKLITIISDNYPEFLKKWYKPPFMVEQVGNKYYYIYGKGLNNKYELFEDNQPYDKNINFNGDTRQEQLYCKFVSQFQLN